MIKRTWRVCRALLVVFAAGMLTGMVGIFSNENAKEKMVSLLSGELHELNLAWQDLRQSAN